MNLRPLGLFLISAGVCAAAPISLKELDFLVRQQTPVAEILQAVAERRLLTPIDEAAERELTQNGAAKSLIAALKNTALVLSPEESQAERRRRMEMDLRMGQAVTAEAALQAQKLQQEQRVSEYRQRAGTIRQLLNGNLVRFEGNQFRPVDPQQIEGVRVFAFYYSAMWCGPCRKFTPQLVAAYKQLKAQYPTQFELIFVSRDRDEFNMKEYMQSHEMPWPAVRFDAVNAEIGQFAGDSIPWLVAVAESGQPLTRNGVDKKYIDPTEVLTAIQQLLGQLKRN